MIKRNIFFLLSILLVSIFLFICCACDNHMENTKSPPECYFDCGHSLNANIDDDEKSFSVDDTCPKCSYIYGYNAAIESIHHSVSLDSAVDNMVVYEVLSNYFPEDKVDEIMEEIYSKKNAVIYFPDLYMDED